MRFWTAILLGLVLSACSTLDRSEKAALADYASTEIGIRYFNLKEANPMGVAGTSIGKLYVLYVLRPKLGQEDRNDVDRLVQSLWFGAAANNLVLYIGGIPFFLAPAVGVIVGFYVYQEWQAEPINTITNK